MTAHNEPRYLQVRLRRPTSLWPVARLLSLGAVAALCVTLLTAPETGLFAFWNLIVPLLPAVFMLAPGLWRNVCPMAAANQLPRVAGLTRGFELPPFLARHGYAVAVILFLALVLGRGALFEADPGALAALLAGVVLAALAAGVVFKGKSGFCGGICPLRPVQGLYGQTPFAEVATSHCRPCLGCTPHCPDLKPRTAFLDDLRDADPRRGAYRKLFAGSFPGFILAFYTLPTAGAAGVEATAAGFAVLTLASLGAFFVVDALSRPRVGAAPALWGALAFGAFYWFNVPTLAAAVGGLTGGPAPDWVIWEGRALALGLGAAWLFRTLRKERAAAARDAKAGVSLPLAGTTPVVEAVPARTATADGVTGSAAEGPLPAGAPATGVDGEAAAAWADRTGPDAAAPGSAAPGAAVGEPPDLALETAAPPQPAGEPGGTAAPAAGVGDAPATASETAAPAAPPLAPSAPGGEPSAPAGEPSAPAGEPSAPAAIPLPLGPPAGSPDSPPEVAPAAGEAPPPESPAVPVTVMAAASADGSPPPVAGDPPVPVPDRRSGDRRMRLVGVTLMPEGRLVDARPGSTLLDVARANGVDLEPGCRMGLCGCDPIYVLGGIENLSPAGEEELATIERLNLGPHARMACCARLLGDVTVSLEPPLTDEVAGDDADEDGDALEAGAGGAGAVGGPGPESLHRVVIVGNGIAGVTAADHIRRRHADCEIHLITDERHPFYNRTSVSRLIYARTGMQRMYLLPDTWYDERRITAWLNTRVVRIDRDAQQVVLGTGEELAYDRLVLATGSSPAVPPIQGFQREGSFTLRQAEDAMRIRAYAQRADCRRAVVAGGGVLGLEAADALRKLGLQVTVIERSGRLAPAQVSESGGRLLRAQMEDRGIEVVLETSVASVRGNGMVGAVALSDGTAREADLFLVCAGITPNAELAREAGLEVERGVVVDDAMRTSDPLIFAAGDVAEHDGRVYGLWPAGVEQAEVVAANAVGGDRAYRGSVLATHLKVAGVELTSIGRAHLESDRDAEIVLEDADARRQRRLVIADGRIVGAVLLGHPADAGPVFSAIKERRDVRGELEALRAGDWDFLSETHFEEAVAAPIARYRHESFAGGGAARPRDLPRAADA